MLELLFGKSPTPSVLAVRARSGKVDVGLRVLTRTLSGCCRVSTCGAISMPTLILTLITRSFLFLARSVAPCSVLSQVERTLRSVMLRLLVFTRGIRRRTYMWCVTPSICSVFFVEMGSNTWLTVHWLKGFYILMWRRLCLCNRYRKEDTKLWCK